MTSSINIKRDKKNSLKIFIAVILVITLIISLIEFTTQFHFWLKEIGRNFVISLSIGGFILVLDYFFDLTKIENKFIDFLKVVVSFAAAGFAGGALAWLLNELLFGFNVTHPFAFFLKTSGLSIAFGLGIFSYFLLRERFLIASKKLIQKEINEQKLLRLNKEAELKALRAMVNPHFLFNTLNSISSLIYEDQNKAEDTTQKLSSLFRKVLNASEKEFHRLSDEITLVEDYLKIEKVRLEDRLNYKINVDPQIEEFFVPTLILQPLVENAIVHGISKLRGGGSVNVHCSKSAADLSVTIRNTKKPDEPVNENRFGISGILERLNLHYGENYSFNIQTEQDEFIVEMIIPAEANGNER